MQIKRTGQLGLIAFMTSGTGILIPETRTGIATVDGQYCLAYVLKTKRAIMIKANNKVIVALFKIVSPTSFTKRQVEIS